MATETDFRRRVVAAVRRIPAGRVATYGDIAVLAGRPRAWRAVGNIMRTCGRGVPCHRVIGASGALGGYGGHLELKRQLLRLEGVDVGRTRVRQFDRVRFHQPPPTTHHPSTTNHQPSTTNHQRSQARPARRLS